MPNPRPAGVAGGDAHAFPAGRRLHPLGSSAGHRGASPAPSLAPRVIGPEARPTPNAAAATTISSTPSARRLGFCSVVASGKKCTPTPKQISTGIHRSCPVPPRRPAPAPSSPELQAHHDPVPAPHRRVAHRRQRTRRPPGHHHPGHGQRHRQPGAHGERDHQPRRRVGLPPPEPYEGEEPVDDHGDPAATPAGKQTLHRPDVLGRIKGHEGLATPYAAQER
jgi:hypothetical protein